MAGATTINARGVIKMADSRIYIILFILVLALGCNSDGTDSGELFSSAQGHPENWVNPEFKDTDEYHTSEVIVDPDQEIYDFYFCRECHGDELDGGVSSISCYSCHNGPEGLQGHPSGWRVYYDPFLFHERYADQYLVSCTASACHGGDLTGGDLGPTCFASECHTEDEEWNIYSNE